MFITNIIACLEIPWFVLSQMEKEEEAEKEASHEDFIAGQAQA